ncbi:MMPL family transporter [Spirillospora sp. CA-142024]|uniref:MMPL family transporter n=1 Tax=Spirillospora sp. CA-142024 TaxID=3240036 RepID=UPI003D8D7DB7
MLAAAVILFIAFGSLVAMGLPIVTALMAILGGIALTKLVGYVVPSPDFTALVAAMIGLGVGIDYALFIVTRYKESLQDGDEPESATVKAITTAGRAVLFAGTTVVIALLGLVAMGQRLMTGVAQRNTSHEILSEGFGPGYGAPLIFATEVDSKDADLSPVVDSVRKTEGIA